MSLGRYAGPLISTLVGASVLAEVPRVAPSPPPIQTRSIGWEDGADVRLARGAADGLARWDTGDPTDEEQHLLELINRTRMNPAAETAILRDHPDVLVQQAYTYFKVDFNRMLTDMARYVPLPPLAPHGALLQAARGHSQWMLVNADQSHFQGTIGVGQRATAAGYPWQTMAENLFAFSENPEHAHAGLEVDWGLFDGMGNPIAPGMQDPPGHRDNNHSPLVHEVGVGLVKGRNSRVVNGQVQTVGPLLYTVNFGARAGAPPAVTGVAYLDLDGDGSYGEGEGLGGVRVDVSGSTHYATTAGAGGYAVPTSNGLRQVTFSAAGMEPVTRAVVVSGGGNVKADLRLAYEAPVLHGAPVAAVGRANAFVPTSVPGATSYRWTALQRTPLNFVWNAEAGLERLLVNQSPGYQVVQSSRRASGAFAYRLTTPQAADQTLTLSGRYLAGDHPSIRFAVALGYATADQSLVLEISDDDGVKWRPVWRLRGRYDNIDSAFSTQTVAVPEMAWREFRVRFRFEVGVGSYYNTVESGEGVFLDDIQLLDTTSVAALASGEVAAGTPVQFVPPSAGQVILTTRPINGARALPSGVGIPVEAVVGAPAPVVRLAPPALRGEDRIRIGFAIESGSATDYVLESAATLSGPWNRVMDGQLGATRSGGLHFDTGISGGDRFYRVRLP